MNDVEIYNKMHDMAGFEKGDKIRLLRLWGHTDFNTGTAPLCIKHKVGEVYTVTSNIPSTVHGHKMLHVEEGGFVPFFAVELVKKAPKWEPQVITLNYEYTATVNAHNVVVGCQEFKFSAIEELYNFVQEAKAFKA